ncbi:LLM class flavin-dependent oxidoreductase [Segeticoccus rhizosphaerae]|jgi:alkanesulfonate monooxygenase SsuD/methylene tetrahydromethanopterin reductase-like flavin-dependent oxidoreductase (luciferase family)|uniref:LLM class flavin-dependent oxidoreductase n=1 Tax=Segeticoccus rhizosphaerae TaxID=1104777 RepID=UPI001264C008|nr:LLM class flavin-dependent oxidoreductase [Segeticoccus rhizosphaerae]
MRFGIVILPEHRWCDAAPLWRRAEGLGFDHAWTYDHLTWSGLPDSPWFGTVSTMTAAAMVTERIRLGTYVSSPNYRHPVTFSRDLLALDDISQGRLTAGLGTGGDLDSRILGGAVLTRRQRADRFEEFVTLLDRLLTSDHVDYQGTYFGAIDARTLPGPVQQPRIPFVVAANGPRSMRLAARFGSGWVTTGRPGAEPEQWWAAVREAGLRMDQTLDEAGRPRDELDRYLSIDASGVFALSSVAGFEEAALRAAELGFTDVVCHWPRPEGPYAGDPAVLEQVATEVLPRLRKERP